LCIRYVSGRRNQSCFSFNRFRKPCNHPNLWFLLLGDIQNSSPTPSSPPMHLANNFRLSPSLGSHRKKVTGQTTSTVSLLIIQVDTSERECQFLLLSRELPD
jgi:hypothetical protein